MKNIKDIIIYNSESDTTNQNTYRGRIIIDNNICEGFVRNSETQEEKVVFGTIVDEEFIELVISEQDEEKLPIAYKTVLKEQQTFKSSVIGHNYPIAEYNGILLYKTAYYEYEIGDCKLKTVDPYFYCSVEQEDYDYIEKRILANENFMNSDSKELYRTIIKKEKNKQSKKKINKHNI